MLSVPAKARQEYTYILQQKDGYKIDHKKIGIFISELRKEKNMTQKDLAEKLNVTDKAVSKWERGAGYPEITILPHLADALGVTTSELLQGEHAQEEKQIQGADAEPIVRSAVEYAQQTRTRKNRNAKVAAFYLLTIALLLAAGICALCNYVSRHTLDWSLYVMGAEVVAWLTVTPLLRMEKHRCVVSLAVLTLSSIPLLLLIKALCPSPEIIVPFVFPIVGISLCSLWLLLPLTRLKIRTGYFVSLLLLIYGVAVHMILSSFINGYLHSGDSISTPIVSASCAFAAIVIAVVTRLKSTSDN